jgi:hypothetical protein
MGVRMPDSNSGWTLTIPFTVESPMRVKESITAVVNGLTIEVRSGGGDYDQFVIEGIESADEARLRFEMMKTGALTAGLYIAGGVRFGRELAVLHDGVPSPSDPAQPIAFPKNRDLSGFSVAFGKPEFQIDKVLPRFMEGLRIGLVATRVQQAMLDPKVSLAGLLYTDSHYEASPQAQFIGFIGVLEVLKDQELRSKSALALVDRWQNEVALDDAAEAESLQSTLKNLRSISIGQGIRSVVSRHLGDDAAREAAKLYSQRSRLVHEGIQPDDMEAVARKAATLAAKLLARILSVGNR